MNDILMFIFITFYFFRINKFIIKFLKILQKYVFEKLDFNFYGLYSRGIFLIIVRNISNNKSLIC